MTQAYLVICTSLLQTTLVLAPAPAILPCACQPVCISLASHYFAKLLQQLLLSILPAFCNLLGMLQVSRVHPDRRECSRHGAARACDVPAPLQSLPQGLCRKAGTASP